MRRIKVLNEEISRWAFEIIYKRNKQWHIAFTNPTAGPWKTIKGIDNSGNEGEVYRFPLEETRPDIIMFNDKLKAIIIIEAKDSLNKLVAGDQAEKSVEVVERLADILSKLDDNPYWGERAKYSTYLGLLWGSPDISEKEEDVNKVFDSYYSLAKSKKNVNKDFIVGVESLYKGGTINCCFKYKTYTSDQINRYLDIIESLK